MTQPEARSQQIAAELRQRIVTGTLGPGVLLPSEPELARDHGVSRQTARAALQMLEREGLVTVRPRRGRIVRSQNRLRWRLSEFELPENTGTTTADAWEADIERQGHDPTRQDLMVTTITPPNEIAARLNLSPATDLCVVRRRTRYIDGNPAIISDDYFDERIVRGTELAEPRDTTREDILAEAGYPQTYDIDEIITRMPTPTEIERLQIPAGTPVAEHIRTGYTAENQAVRVMVSIIPGDTLILQYKVPT
ncbi:MAG: GntR family transcriptional regulator [Pseudonocardiaceae bacterium]|jgi:GntR family transcriptional regulator